MPHDQQETELVLMPNESCFYLDRTKGNLNVVVGPFKQSLSQTDQLVRWDNKAKRMVPVEYANAKKNCIVIPEGWYAPLKNPATQQEHPEAGKISDQSIAGLKIGKKVNIAGPDSFALWPGQMAKVIEGHKLRSNQYLLVRVYDVDAFKAELANSELGKNVDPRGKDVDPRRNEEGRSDTDDGMDAASDENVTARTTEIYGGLDRDKLATGQQFIIRGTEVHFYIPPNGIEVISYQYRDREVYVQSAITLEQLQYCILQDENGQKRYVRGPAVVFPRPTEKFLQHPG